MALKRYIPVQDTFIVSGSEYNFGVDEILELGNIPGSGISRILMKFSDISLKNRDTAILHLYVSEACNLPGPFTIEAAELKQDWLEGIGRTGDLNKMGATWKYTGISTGTWEIPGAVSGSEFVSQSFSNQNHLTAIDLDITELITSQSSIVLKFGNEAECLEYGSNISFYSKDTHTIYRPYLEVRWDDSEYVTGSLAECKNLYSTFASNLQEKYTVGDMVRVNLSVKDLYASRIWTTGSIYQPMQILPESSYWGIKDEYTNEMIVDFNRNSTKISADDSGSFFILDTSNLEPERYYRLLIQVKKDGQNIVVDNKNIFRIDRNGQC